jgi:hypothetical protein
MWETLVTDASLVGQGFNTPFGLALSHANIWTGAITLNAPNIGTTATNMLVLGNSTLATSGTTIQESPSEVYWGSVRNSTTTIDTVAMRVRMIPTNNGGYNDQAVLYWDAANATASSYTNVMQLKSSGSLSFSPTLNLPVANSVIQIGGAPIVGYYDAAQDGIGIGSASSSASSSGPQDIVVGYSYTGTGWNFTSGKENTAVGSGNPYLGALYSCTTGNYNTAVGDVALASLVSNSQNSALGFEALYSCTGTDNTAVGFQAGYAGTAITSGTENTFLGSGAGGASATLTNAMALGYDASVTASNTIQLGNSSVTGIMTYGHDRDQSTIGSASDDGTGITSVSVAGGDRAGTITYTSATNVGGGYMTINFGTTYGTAPVVVIGPGPIAPASGNVLPQVTATATYFTITFSATTTQTGGTFNYMVVGR